MESLQINNGKRGVNSVHMLLSAGAAANGSAAPYLYRDLHAAPDVLPMLAAERAKLSPHGANELILLTSNWGQYDLTVNLIASLAALGLHHYLLLTDNSRLTQYLSLIHI